VIEAAAFDVWVREAEERLRLGSDYPLIDDDQIDMAEELRACADLVVDEFLGEVSTSTPAEIEPTIGFFEIRLISSDSALPVRFVILNFLYRLAHFASFANENSVQEIYWAVWPHLERFVRLQEISVLYDTGAVRWEITNACVIQDWDRASMLFDRLKSLGAITASEHRALKGQMYACSVVAMRSGGTDFLDWWAPRLDRTYSFGSSSMIRPLTLLTWGMNLTADEECSEGERERLSDAAHEWEKCFGENSDPHGSYVAAWGKCYFLNKEYLSAAKRFEWLLARGCGLPPEMEISFRHLLYLNAAECFRKGGDAQGTIRRLEDCAREFPQTKGLWLKLAGVYLSSPLDPDLQERVLECLRKEEAIDPAFGEDPRTSIALTLGELAGSGFRAELRKIGESNLEKLQIINALFSKHWLPFQSLDEKSRKEWSAAVIVLWGTDPDGARLCGGELPACSPKEGQLRGLLNRFRAERGTAVSREIGSSLTLGQMIYEIDSTLRLAEPSYPDLKSWLQNHADPLVQNWDSTRAWRLNKLRVSCSHPGSEITEQDTLELYNLSIWFVNQLAEN
jgi:hypothetical protein